MTTDSNTRPRMHDEPLFRPWGIVDPAFWAGPPAPPPPADPPAPATEPAPPVSSTVADELAAIQAAAASDLARANTLAEELDATTTAARGERHIDTLRVREVRAYLVHLTGHHDTAVAWYLHVVHLHADLHGPSHEETTLAVRRAYSMWKSLPASDAQRLAGDLIKAFAEVPGAGAQAIQRIRGHLGSLRRPVTGGTPAAPAS
ncbi:hypothetical protein [Streptomyces sp. NPDC001717]|uniref:hypothetical protein n=1 Tax=Streptomyces sp. NPDC001717 TaxID=3364604 RepID=UPI0036C3A7E6